MSLDDLIRDLPSAEQMKEIQAKVAEVVKGLSEQATRFAEKYRLRGRVMTIGVTEDPKTWDELLLMLKAHGHRFVITRIGDAWDVYHAETPNLWNLWKREQQAWTRIQACRLEVKIVFVRNAKKIFTDYFKHVQEFLENAPKEIAHADAVIRELQELLKPVATE